MVQTLSLALLSFFLITIQEAAAGFNKKVEEKRHGGTSVFKVLGYVAGEHDYSGTGYLAEDWLGLPQLVTNAHVCEQLPPPMRGERHQMSWKLADGRHAIPIKIDFEHDLCLMRVISKTTDVVLKIASELDRTPKTVYHICGHPHSVKNVVCTSGIFKFSEVQHSGFEPRDVMKKKYNVPCIYDGEADPDECLISRVGYRFSFTIAGGSSGSPVLNEREEVVGIVWGTPRSGEDAAVIPLLDIREILGYNWDKEYR